VLIIQAIIILLITAERLFPLFQEWWLRRKLSAELESHAQEQEAAS
jgi:hypothetical protein